MLKGLSNIKQGSYLMRNVNKFDSRISCSGMVGNKNSHEKIANVL